MELLKLDIAQNLTGIPYKRAQFSICVTETNTDTLKSYPTHNDSYRWFTCTYLHLPSCPISTQNRNTYPIRFSAALYSQANAIISS